MTPDEIPESVDPRTGCRWIDSYEDGDFCWHPKRLGPSYIAGICPDECPFDFGEWGAWRSVAADITTIAYPREPRMSLNAPLRIKHTYILDLLRAYQQGASLLDASGWSP